MSSLLLRVICFCLLSSCVPVTRGDVPVTDRWEDPTSASIYLFGTDMLQNMAKGSKTNENAFVSPLSAYIALSMLHLAAKNQTRANLEDILKIPQSNTDITKFHENLSARLGEIRNSPYLSSLETLLSNGFFMDETFPINDQYIQLLKKYYGNQTMVKNLNFHENINATNFINSWISNGTKNLIRDFIESPLSMDTRAMLTSAIYFKGTWVKLFNETMTTTEKFNSDEGEIHVQMMSAENYVPYYSDTDLKFDSIELQYEGREYAMIIALPHHSQSIHNLTQHLHLVNFKQYKRNQRLAGVEYKIPKMKITSTKSLIEALHLENALNALELSVMTPSYRDVTIQDVKQATKIEVNENGTVATAVTEEDVHYLVGSGFQREILFVVDRPFVMHIVHRPTYTLLFSGIITNPMSDSIVDSSDSSFVLWAVMVLLLALALIFSVVFYLRYKRRREDASYR